MAVLTQDQLKKLRESGLNDNEISSLAQKNGFTLPTTTPSKVLSTNEVFSLKKQGLNDTEISTLAQKNNIGLPEQNQDGFFKSTLKDVAKTLLVKPAIRTAQALAAVPVYTFGSDATKQRYQEQIAKDVKVPFTGITVEGQRKFGEGGATQIASDTLKSASYLYGGQGATKAVGGLVKGKIAQPIATGAFTGAVGGATYGAGEEMVNPEATIGSTLKAGAVGGVAGGVLGGAIPAIGAGIKPSYKIIKDTAGKTKMLFASPEDKALYVVNKRTEELGNIVNKSSPLKKLVTSAESQGYNPIKDLSDSDLLVGVVNKDGRIDGKLVQERFNEVMDVPEGIIKKKFEETGEKISLDQVQARMAEVLNSDYVPSKIYKQVQNKYDDIVYGLYQKGKVDADGMVKFADLQQEKIDAYKLSNFLDPEKTMGDKAIGRAFKNVIDQDSKSIPELEQINKELGRYLSVKSLIDKLDQKVVKGGRLGKYFAKGVGAVVGSVGGPVGSILTAEGMGALQGQILKGTFGKTVGKDIFEGSLETLKNQSKNVDALQIPQANTINATKNVIPKSIPPIKKSSQAGFISTGGKGVEKLNWNKIPEEGVKVEIPLDKLRVSTDALEKATKNVKRGDGSRTSGPIDVAMLKDGTFAISEGHHRTVQKMLEGKKTIEANVYSTKYSASPDSIYDKLDTTFIKPNKDLQPLYKEAQKYKSAEEFVKSKLDENSFVNKEPIKVYRGEGSGIGNRTLVNGKYFADSEKFASNFGKVSTGEIPAGSKIFDLDKVKTGKGIISDEALVDPERLTNYLIDNGYEYTKNTNTRGTEYVKLARYSRSSRVYADVRDFNELNDLFGDLIDKSDTYSDFAKKVLKKRGTSPKDDYYKYNLSIKLKNYWNQVKKNDIPQLNLPKETKLEKIWKEANSKTSTKQGMTVVNPLTAIAGSSALLAGASKLSKKENKK